MDGLMERWIDGLVEWCTDGRMDDVRMDEWI